MLVQSRGKLFLQSWLFTCLILILHLLVHFCVWVRQVLMLLLLQDYVLAALCSNKYSVLFSGIQLQLRIARYPPFIYFSVSVVFSHNESSFLLVLALLFVFVSTVQQSTMKSRLLLFLYYLYMWNKRINALPTISGLILVMCAVRIVQGMPERLWVQIL